MAFSSESATGSGAGEIEDPTPSSPSLRHRQDDYISYVASQGASATFADIDQIEPANPVTSAHPSGATANDEVAKLTGIGGFLIFILILMIVIALGSAVGAIGFGAEATSPIEAAYWAWQFLLAVIYIILMLSKKRAARWYAIIYHLGAQVIISLLLFGPTGVSALSWSATGGGAAFAAYWWFSKRVRYTYTR